MQLYIIGHMSPDNNSLLMTKTKDTGRTLCNFVNRDRLSFSVSPAKWIIVFQIIMHKYKNN